MGEETASFKVALYLEGSKSKPEIRRFVLPRSALYNFVVLKEKLKTIFQCIQDVPFNVMWEDRDGDQIIISSDEELRIAMSDEELGFTVSEKSGEVYRLKIEVKSEDKSETAQGNSNKKDDGIIHPGVTCDGCNDGIFGFRYKCIQCDDFDLCHMCEMKKIHKEHFMIRIPQPMAWKPEFGHRLLHHMNKSARKFRGFPAGGCGQDKTRCGSHQHRSHHFGEFSGGTRNQARFESFPQLIQFMFRNMWDVNPESSEPPRQDEQASGTGKPESGETAAADPKKAPEKDEDIQVTYLKSIGETVATLLDPLGIDVNIKVETQKDGKVTEHDIKEPKNTTTDNSTDNVSTASSSNASPIKKNNSESKLELSAGLEESNKQEDKKADNQPDADDWTVVNNEESLSEPKKINDGEKPKDSNDSVPANEVKDTQAAKNVENQQERKSTSSAYHYPDLGVFFSQPPPLPGPLPPNMQAPRPPMGYMPGHFVPNPFPHQVYAPPPPPPPPMPYPTQPTRPLSPKVAEALAKMISMGFSNEGGWLTQLLEAVNGDIHRALDILQPIKK